VTWVILPVSETLNDTGFLSQKPAKVKLLGKPASRL